MKRHLLTLLALVVGWGFPATVGAVDAVDDPVVRALQTVMPAVVNISTEQIVERTHRDPFDDFWRQFFGQPRRPQTPGGQSLGSGVIVDEDGWIVTNFHVVRRASKIDIQLSDGSRFEAQYVSGDERHDLALLKIAADRPLPAVELATDREPLLGETMIAVGNPFGLEHTVTKGVLSAKNRRYTAGDIEFDDILQTDASINPGNSGGPLINTRGQLVGINMAILSQAQGIGFAIPAKRVALMLARWFTPEKRARLWLGVRFDWVDERIVIADVQAGSPASAAGVAAQDRVVTVDGQAFADLLRLQRHLIHRKAGDSVRLEVERDGKPLTMSVKLAALPQVSAADLLLQKFGLQTQLLTRDLAQAFGLSISHGLLVAEVQADSPAAAAGFRRGMVITHVGGEEFRSLERLAELLMDVQPNDEVALAVVIAERRGNMLLQQTASATLRAR